MRNITTAMFLAMVIAIPESHAMSAIEVLKKVENTLNAPSDRSAIQRMTLIDQGGATKDRTMKVYQKGTDLRMIVFKKPADVRGIGFLSINEDRMYLYLPAFRKVRRIASHIKNENFLGSDFSYEDLAETRYTDDYSVSSMTEQEGAWVLDLVPLSGVDVSYTKLRMSVSKANYLPLRIEYFVSNEESPVKILRSENHKQEDGYHYPGTVEMESMHTGHKTILEVLEISHDTGLVDKFFTERNLKRQGR